MAVTTVPFHLFQRGLRTSGQPTHENYYGSLDGSFGEHSEDSFEINDWKLPDMDLINKIKSQVEFYLSDENLAEDAFLLKHIRRNKMGFVSIKLLSSFKRVKFLTKDWRVTLHALRFSDLLEVNEEGTKVRRKIPVAESILCLPSSKLILAWNLPDSPAEAEALIPAQKGIFETTMKIFGTYGIVSSIRILRPGRELPVELKKYSFKYPELGSKTCALVEYENLEGARKAYEELNKTQSSASGENVKIVLLGGRGTKKKNYAANSEDSEDGGRNAVCMLNKNPTGEIRWHTVDESLLYSSSESDSLAASPIPICKYLYTPGLSSSSFSSPSLDYKFGSCSSPCSGPNWTVKALGSSFSSDNGHGASSSPSTSPEMCKRLPNSFDSGHGSPWVQRRKMNAAYGLNLENKHVPFRSVGVQKCQDSSGLPPGVLRLPYGPDGTKGFYNCIGRGKLVLRH